MIPLKQMQLAQRWDGGIIIEQGTHPLAFFESNCWKYFFSPCNSIDCMHTLKALYDKGAKAPPSNIYN